MNGFFSKRETTSNTRPDGKNLSCVSCGLFKFAESPKMEPYGNFKKGIMNIGEFPSQIDDRRNMHWNGRGGRLLSKTLEELGINLFEDCVNLNATNCFTSEEISGFEISCCQRIVLKYINEYKPKLIILYGTNALISVIGNRWKKELGSLEKWRGWQIPDQDFKTWICPVYNPNYVVHKEQQDIELIFKNDLKSAIETLNKPFPIPHEPRINIIDDLSILKQIPSHYACVATDIEATGLKPQKPGHKIVCASVAVSTDNVFTFMIPQTRDELKPYTDILEDPMIEKMAHNMKYEDTWITIKFRKKIENWAWDSMMAAHNLDNRRGITGLKFQVYVNFGVIDYSSEISPYLEATDPKDGNSFNRILDLIKTKEGREKLLIYNAWDSIWEYRLAELQKSLILFDDLPF